MKRQEEKGRDKGRQRHKTTHQGPVGHVDDPLHLLVGRELRTMRAGASGGNGVLPSQPHMTLPTTRTWTMPWETRRSAGTMPR